MKPEAKPALPGPMCSVAKWVDARKHQPKGHNWPIIAYFGRAAKGCRGPCVMLSNWNGTFTHWQELPVKLLQTALDGIPMPKPPNAPDQRPGEQPKTL